MKQLFCVVSMPRTGSTHLCSLLHSHPSIVCHREVFNRTGIHTKSPASICLSACMAAKIGAKVVGYGRYVTFQLVEVAVPRELFRKMLCLIDGLRPRPAPA